MTGKDHLEGGSFEFPSKTLNPQSLILFIISETKELSLPGHHSGSIHHQVISLKVSSEMNNKMVIKSFITVHAQ